MNGERALDHATLWARSCALARALRARGVGPEQRVVLDVSRSPELLLGMIGTWMAEGEANAQMANNPRLRPSMDRIARYGQNLFLMRGSQTASTIDNIRKLVQEHRRLSGDRRLVLFVDYLQKVPVIPEPVNET